MLKFEDAIGKVFRHKRLFNYVISPISESSGIVTCISGSNMTRDIPMDYFKRDWKIDLEIELSDLMTKIEMYPTNTPFTNIYSKFFEKDDGEEQAYLHFDEHGDEQFYRFPIWQISIYNKVDRDISMNPFTLIMPVLKERIIDLQEDLDIINDIRQDNEYIDMDDFAGFEFGLIKFLEKKYLRDI